MPNSFHMRTAPPNSSAVSIVRHGFHARHIVHAIHTCCATFHILYVFLLLIYSHTRTIARSLALRCQWNAFKINVFYVRSVRRKYLLFGWCKKNTRYTYRHLHSTHNRGLNAIWYTHVVCASTLPSSEPSHPWCSSRVVSNWSSQLKNETPLKTIVRRFHAGNSQTN